MKSITGERTVDQDQAATLECEADANPVVEQVVLWSRPGYDMGRAVLVSVIRLDKTSIPSLVYTGTGAFIGVIVQCSCSLSVLIHTYTYTHILAYAQA